MGTATENVCLFVPMSFPRSSCKLLILSWRPQPRSFDRRFRAHGEWRTAVAFSAPERRRQITDSDKGRYFSTTSNCFVVVRKATYWLRSTLLQAGSETGPAVFSRVFRFSWLSTSLFIAQSR